MSYKVELTPKARKDMDNIFEYIAYDLQSYQNATGQIVRLRKEIDSLNEMPGRFRIYDKKLWRSRNLRVMPVDNFLVFYMIDNTNKIVTVTRVQYGRRDINRQLNN